MLVVTILVTADVERSILLNLFAFSSTKYKIVVPGIIASPLGAPRV